MRLIRVIVALCIFTTLASLATAQSRTDRELINTIDAIVAAEMEKNTIAGMAIGIARGDEIVLAKGYGLADVENDVAVTGHTVFRIGSLTKQFTSSAIMLLVEQEKLSIDDKLSDLLPEFPETEHKVTLAHLLNHTSGIKSYTAMPTVMKDMRLDLSQKQMMDRIGAAAVDFKPGEKYKYNNSGYYLLGIIIEKTTGKSYKEFLMEKIFDPLGLSETHYLDNAPIIPRRAEGYSVRNGALLNDAMISMRLPYSAGSLGSSVLDLMKWQKALATYKLVSEKSFKLMTTPRKLTSGEKMNYGFGLISTQFQKHKKITHNGAIPGFLSSLTYFPDDEITIVVLQNTESGNTSSLSNRIARVVLKTPSLKSQD